MISFISYQEKIFGSLTIRPRHSGAENSYVYKAVFHGSSSQRFSSLQPIPVLPIEHTSLRHFYHGLQEASQKKKNILLFISDYYSSLKGIHIYNKSLDMQSLYKNKSPQTTHNLDIFRRGQKIIHLNVTCSLGLLSVLRNKTIFQNATKPLLFPLFFIFAKQVCVTIMLMKKCKSRNMKP